MASISGDEENINQTETGGRRTRSGRKTTVSTAPTTPRSTRRSTRRQTNEHLIEPEPFILEENLRTLEVISEEQRITVIEDDQPQQMDQNDIIQEMIAEAAQGHLIGVHNKLHSDVEIVEETEQQIVEENIDLGESIEQIVEELEAAIPLDDDKSSSFPFGIAPENSDGKTEENVGDVDGSLLASLVGDNANSLPSAGDESLSRENFDTSDMAIAEDLPNGGINQRTLDDVDDAELVSEDELPPAFKEKVTDAENVSEDELPAPTKPKVTDAEEVSDEELPAPKRAELPADTEVVSEEDEVPEKRATKRKSERREMELPSAKRAELPEDTEIVSEDEFPSTGSKKDDGVHGSKRKSDENYDPGSPTGESTDVPEKKTKTESEEKEKKKKKLPELDKYWKTVKEDPADFTGWTYLLQYVDQENDVEAAREAYDSFLAHYPYCYGYWRKYADYEKRKGDKTKCDEVFERGLKAIPLSVDLWIHYLTHVKNIHSDNVEYVRVQFERAISACGLEFRSDKLWEAFIKWEHDAKRYNYVAKIYDRLLATPTQGYNGHFESFQDLISNHASELPTIIDPEEYARIKSEILENSEKVKEHSKEPTEKASEPEKTEGVDEGATVETAIMVEDECASKEEKTAVAADKPLTEDEVSGIRDKFIASRRKIHKATVAAVTIRWTYEEGIKRPYFHVKPLERCQLKNWKEYLDFEIEQGDRKRILVLFERCLIACALYDEFWLKLIRYLEAQNEPELLPNIHDAFERACTIHHPDKPSLHLLWAAFEECCNNYPMAAEILINIEQTCPDLLQIAYRRVNLERRRGNFDQCKELYEHNISTAKNKNVAGTLAIKYARFCHKIQGNLDGGLEILKAALEKDPSNTRVALQMIDLTLQRPTVNEEEVVEIMDKFMSREGMDAEQKVLFAQRKVEFLEDFGSTAKGLQDAQRALQIALSKAAETKKKSESSPTHKKPSKEVNATGGSGTAVSSSSAANYNSVTGNYGYSSGTTNSGYYGNNQSYPSYDGYGYNHWQQYGSGYSGYNQWSGYGNYY